MEKLLTGEEIRELNELFECNKFSNRMNKLDLFTTELEINSKKIGKNKNNLKLLVIDRKVKIKKVVGEFIRGTNMKLMKISFLDEKNDKIKEMDFDCSTLYSNCKGEKQRDDIENNKVYFKELIGNVFVPKSNLIGFKILYLK